MRSFISSSSVRIALFLVVLTCLMALGLWLKAVVVPPEEKTLTAGHREFFYQKVRPEKFEIAVYGDSRTYQGVVPEILTSVLHRTCMNYGFSSGGINHEMLKFLDARLARSESWPGVIVLGVTPLSLTGKNRANEQYHEMLAAWKVRARGASSRCADAGGPLGPFPLRLFLDHWAELVDRADGSVEYSEFGWCGSSRPSNWKLKHERTLKGYRSKFGASRVSESSVGEMIDWIARWRKQGVRTFLFRVPTCRRMVELEDEVSGFDEASVRAKVEAAGGVWLEMDSCKYESNDASHLSKFGARALTVDLAREIDRWLSHIKM